MEERMAQMLDCLVNYFGLNEDEEPGLRRHYCYHVIGGPGPTPEGGVATITTLSVYEESERCTFCDVFHAVEMGGPAAAIAKAIRYLDDIHLGKHTRKVQTEIRDSEASRERQQPEFSGR
jgi:hypothetical protein